MKRSRRRTSGAGSDRGDNGASSFGSIHRIDPSRDPILRDIPCVEGYKVLGPCVLYAKLGRGGMGVVYRGKHLNLHVDVAVKCLDPSLVERCEEFTARFQREASLAARINHPNVVRVFDVSEYNSIQYLIMEYVEGEDARHRVIRKGPLSVREATKIILGAGSGVAEAHRQGMVHRDVKPDNILISISGEVKIADLGLAKIRESHTEMTQEKSRMGTPNYMPLEQWESMKDVGPQADVWSLGTTMYFLLAGDDAIQGHNDYEILNSLTKEPFPDIREKRPDVPEEVVRVIENATKRAPSARYATGSEFLEALQDLPSFEGCDLRDPAGTRELDLQMLVSPPPGKTLAKIRASITDSSRIGTSGVRTKPRFSTKKKTILGLASLSIAVIIALALISSINDRHGRAALQESAGQEPVGQAESARPREVVNRTDYMLLSERRSFIKPMVDETLEEIHWFGNKSHNLPQIPPPKFSPGQVVDVAISWDWVNIRDTPVACIDVYGDWNPDAYGPNTNELYHESIVLPTGGPTPHKIAFSFTVPSYPGMYRIRWMYTWCFDDTYHISSFYGGKAVETNVAAAEVWTEFLFEVVQ